MDLMLCTAIWSTAISWLSEDADENSGEGDDDDDIGDRNLLKMHTDQSSIEFCLHRISW
jgi:hypothetical protein